MPLVAGISCMAQICDGLYICGINSLDIKKMRQLGITHVINLTVDVPDTCADDVTCDRIALDDLPHAKLSDHFDACADKIEAVHDAGGKTLVHCVAGRSRSASICIAYVMKYHKMTLKDAYSLVKEKRPIIRPNVGFFRQLIDYERRLFGVTTVSMMESAMGVIPDVYAAQIKGMYITIPIN